MRRMQRFVVKKIVDGQYTNATGKRCVEKVLLADDERTSLSTSITLRDSWAATTIGAGNIVHIAGLQLMQPAQPPASSPPGQIIISDTAGSPFVIVHPDHMLSATTVADSFDCARKAVLQDRIKATSDSNKAMVYGKILHEVVQQALSSNRWEGGFLDQLVEQTVFNHLEGLWELGMRDTVLAIEEVRAKMGELAAWARIFVNDEPSDVSVVDDRQGEKVWMSISKLIAIEEHIWSPKFGLKGNVDATVQVSLIDNPKQPRRRLIMPFEVKTGRTTNSPAHRAQTALYTLLLSDRYDVSVQAGVLYYLESSAMSRIAPPLVELRQMIQQRNRLASYIYRARNPGKGTDSGEVAQQTREVGETGLPAMLKNPFKCGRCYAQQSCFTFHALVENGSAASAGMLDDGKKNHSLVWQEATGHLRLGAKDKAEAERLKQWFNKWDRLLTFEERDVSRLSKEIWVMSSAEREAAGRCFGRLMISQDLTSTSTAVSSTIVDGIQGSGGKINRFAYNFVRAEHGPNTTFTEGTQLTVGEPIVVSSETGQWALANGYIVAVSKHNITVAVDRRLGDSRERLDDFDAEHNQAFRGVMSVAKGGSTMSHGTSSALYRLDKDEFSNGLALIRNNLVNLMSSHPIHTKLRNQIVFDAAPAFSSTPDAGKLPPSQLGHMNEDQRQAIRKVLSAQDYALILGMPGTGKTTTIAHLIGALLAEDKTILLTSFTHTAVDNILLKVRGIAPAGSILRLGVPAKINPAVQTFCQLAATPRTSIDDIDRAYMDTKIVATTCMGTNHAVFHRRTFDVCIVDEASQITLPTSLGPLLRARKFVLVGDHYQLPPLVQNRAASEGGLDVSLFRQISEQHPQAVAMLGEQYRMCEEIMSLSNALIYGGQLRCGNEGVAQRTLQIADPSGLSSFHTESSACSMRAANTSCWLGRLTAPEHKVVYANTDRCGKAASETLSSGKNITNQLEATLCAQLVLSFLALGVPAREIGIITLYRSQITLLRQLFKAAGIAGEVEIDSADRFQGRDKECVVLSMVRCNDAGVVGDLLKDWRRVNVALTRARSKLVVLGSRRTLRNNELLAKFGDLVDGNGWAVDLPPNAADCHGFAFSSQAASVVAAEVLASSERLRGRSVGNEALSPKKNVDSAHVDPLRVLQPSQRAGNVSPVISSRAGRKPEKVITGRATVGPKARKMREQIAIEILEDLTADDFDDL